MTARNHYGAGRAWESVGYHANGEADDWGFGERGLLSLSLEVGRPAASVPPLEGQSSRKLPPSV